MLINLTNHPCKLWDESQREAAEVYGECVDMPFPNIPPEADATVVDEMAREYVARIMGVAGLSSGEGSGLSAPPESVTVHVMGEQTFCFVLICRLRQLGIRCVASCSQRDVTLMSDGSKQVRFHFARFREYIMAPLRR